MKKPTLDTVLARKPGPEPVPEFVQPQVPRRKVDDEKMTTSLRIKPETLGELKVLALQKRVRVNDVILEAIEDYLALHGRRDAA